MAGARSFVGSARSPIVTIAIVAALGASLAFGCRQAAAIHDLGCAPCGDRLAGRCNEAALCVGPDMQIASHDKHTCARMQDGAVYCWGNNASGEIGDGTQDWAYAPMRASVPVPAVSVSTGYEHTCIIDGDGAIWCWGNNLAGQLGRGTTTAQELDPEKVQGLPPALRAKSLGLGLAHTCALLSDESVWCWGYNQNGQVGAGNFAIGILAPTAVRGLKQVASLAVTKNHVCAIQISDKNQLVCWGENGNGELGDGTTKDAASPVSVRFGASPLSPLADGGSGAAPYNAIDVALGYASSCAAMTDGTVTCWGHGDRGQLGAGDKPDPESGDYPDSHLPRPVLLQDGNPLQGSVAVFGTTGSHACARVSDTKPYELYCWGGNDWGELAYGDPALVAKIVPYARPTILPKDVQSLALGEDHGCALYAAPNALPSVQCFGDLAYLGTGIVIPQEQQAQVLPAPVLWPAP